MTRTRLRTSNKLRCNRVGKDRWSRSRLALHILEDRSVPATFTVSNTLDGVVTKAGDLPGSLRQAIFDANSLTGADTIVFDGSFSNTKSNINLVALLAITEACNIFGPGSDLLTVRQTANFGVLSIAGATFNISGMTITGGTGTTNGGGILTSGTTVNLSDMVITGNTVFADGGGMAITGGTVNLSRCIISNNRAIGTASEGGGIYVSGAFVVTMDQSTVSGNIAGEDGGGLYFFSGGRFTITNSAITGNKASGEATGAGGGGIYFFGTPSGALTLTNTTIANNSHAAVGGGIALLSTATSSTIPLNINNCSIVGNSAVTGGGIRYGNASIPLNINSSVIANNTATTGPDISNATTATTTFNNSAITNNAGAGTLSGSNNQNPAVGLNLSSLAYHGGFTPSYALLPGSGLIDSGNNGLAVVNDQRGIGVNRLFDDSGIANTTDGTDIGAFEVNPRFPIADGTFANVTVNGATPNSLDVFYYAYNGDTMNVASLDNSDVTIITPSGSTISTTFSTSSAVTGGIKATYTFVPPGGTWESSDNGTYTINVTANQVSTLAGKAVAGGRLNTFLVNAPRAFVVTNANDAGVGSLRQAIVDSNANLGSDSITFDPMVFGLPTTITLASSLPQINDSVVITGPVGNLVTVNANRVGRIATILGAGTITVGINNLNFANGQFAGAGGAILIDNEAVTVNNCVFTDNVSTSTGGGAIAIQTAGGSLTADSCTFTGNVAALTADGGAIRGVSGAVMTIRNSTLSGNVAEDGGAIYLTSAVATTALTVEYSTLSNNAATTINGDGGAISFAGTIAPASFKFTNSTFFGNTAAGSSTATNGGGAIHVANTASFTGILAGCTVTGNSATGAAGKGGGLLRSGTTMAFQVDNSIISGNTASSAANGMEAFTTGTVTANYSAFGSSTTGITTFTNTGGKSSVGALARLGTLSFHGGVTRTIALLPSSALIDQGKNLTGKANDQRGGGFGRVVDVASVANLSDGTDVGAYEVDAATSPIADGSFADISSPGGGPLHSVTINYYAYGTETIDTATLDGLDVRVTGPGGFDVPASFDTFSAITGGVAATYKFAVPGGSWDSADNGVYTVSVQPNEVKTTPGLATVSAGKVNTFSVSVGRNLVVTNANDSGPGSLRQALLDANAPVVTVGVDTVSFDPGFFNAAKTIVLNTTEIVVSDSVVISGAGVGPVTISGNSGVTSTGVTGTRRILNVGFAGNPINVSIANLNFANGFLAGAGGAILIDNEIVTITNSTFTSNTSTTTGGGAIAVNAAGGSLTVDNCTFANNVATGTTDGGAIRATSGTTLTVRNSTLSGNTAEDGGAIYMLSSAANTSLLVENSTFSNNKASTANGDGGAIFVGGTTIPVGMQFINSTFTGNVAEGSSTATNGGGAIAMINSTAFTAVISGCTISGNTATGASGKGGGLLRVGASMTFQVDSSIVSGNMAVTGPDGFSTGTVAANYSAFGVTSGITTFTNNQSSIGAVAGLGQLSFHGGPTRTLALLPASAVIDQGKNLSGKSADQRGGSFLRTVDIATIANKTGSSGGTDVGSYEVDPLVPIAEGVFPDITTAGATTQNLIINYYAYGTESIDTSTLDGFDVRVTGPNSFNVLASYQSQVPIANGVQVTYQFATPGGWDFADNGVYNVSIESGQVLTTPGLQSVQAGLVNTLTVRLGQNFVVTNANDSGPGSFRQAIIDANTSTTFASSLSYTDSITFDPSFFNVFRSIPTSTGELKITDSVNIIGPGRGLLTIDGLNASRIFNIDGPNVITVTISDLTATRGRTAASAGAGILTVNEIVNLNNFDLTFCTSAGANGGGIGVTSTATLNLNNTRIIGCFASANGAGIDGGASSSTITATDSTFAGNITGNRGAAIGYAGASNSITLVRSTISGNISGNGGGAMYQSGGTLVIDNCTISNNADIGTGATGGGAFFMASIVNAVTIRNSTFKGNTSAAGPGGAIRVTGTTGAFNISNSVFTGNLGFNSPDISTGVAGNSINATFSSFGSFTGIITLVADAATNALVGIDPQLAPLAGNGGPTLTHLPSSTSPILDQGSSTATVDQRGQTRPFDITSIANGAGGALDIGSVEVNPDIPTVTLAVSDITTSGGGTQTLNIQFTDNTSIDTGTLDNFDIRVTGPRGYNQLATFMSATAGPTPVDAVYEIAAPGGSWDFFDSGLYVVSLENNQVKDGTGLAALGGVLGSFLVYIPGSLKVDNTGDIDDGNYGPGQLTLREALALTTAVSSDDTITFDNTVFNSPTTISMNGTEMMIGDRVTVNGPGSNLLTIDAQQKSRIFNIDQAGSASNTFSISGMTLKNGLVTGNGGAILNNDEMLMFSDMKFLNNRATAIGGAIHNTGKVSVTVTNATFSDNSAGTGQGGGVAFATAASTGNFTSVNFLRNTAGIQGGGVAFGGNSTATFDSVTFDQNVGTTGGALFMSSQLSCTLTNTKFTNNVANLATATNGGGAIRFGGGTFIINNCLFDKNSSAHQGGAISSTTGPFNYTITDTTFSNNTSVSVGGAIASSSTGTTLNATNVVFDHNVSTNSSGGAFYSVTTSNLSFTNTLFRNNEAAASGGGAIRVGGGSLTADSCTFDGNSAADYGGAIGATTGPHTIIMNNSNLINNHANARGGAIAIETGTGGSVTLNFSTVANNRGGNGGGIYTTTSNDVFLNNSTVSGNQATANDTAGGAIAVYQGGIVMKNSTISGNLTNGIGGGGIALLSPLWNGTVDVQNSTIAYNSAPFGVGGGIAGQSNTGNIVLTSSIVAANTAAKGRDIGFLVNRDIQGDRNLVGGVAPGNITFSGVNDPALIGTDSSPVDPGLYPLANNGGTTLTHALRANSKALDQGSNNPAYTTDQRGGLFSRTVDDGAIANAVDGTDIGAVEGPLVVPIATTNLANVPPINTDYVVSVVYQDDTGINLGSIDPTDLVITGPGYGSPTMPTKVVTSGPATKVTADYYFTPPGGGWDAADNGIYSVALVGTVQDTDGSPQTVLMASLGSFQVGVQQTFTVDTVVDEDDGNYSPGDLSLREAIRLANQSTNAADFIVFDKTVFGTPQTITLSLGQLLITDSVSITGPGASMLRISGNNVSRVIECNGPGQLVVNISAVTIADGKTIVGATAGSTVGDAGGLQITDESVTLNGVVVTNNSSLGEAGGIGVGTTGSLTLLNSTVSGNSANGFGGGIYFQDGGAGLIENSTISGNFTKGQGGGLYFFGIVQNSLVIRNSTISGNTAGTIGGGVTVYALTGTLTVQNSTITDNNAGTLGGGIGRTVSTGAAGQFVIANSIIAGNNLGGVIAAAKADLSADLPTPTQLDFSLIGVDDPSNNLTVTGSGNQTGTVAMLLDAKLGPLANNGGPTFTHALLMGSPAIDQGKNFGGSTDQRGIARPQDSAGIPNAVGGDGSDIGAYEVVFALPPTVTKIAINDDAAQRSLVTTLKVTFSETVTFPMGLAAAFDVSGVGKGASGSVLLDISQSGPDVTITFKTGGVQDIDPGNSLKDGQYQLTIFADKVTGVGGTLDGDGDMVSEGSPADNKTLNFFRLFGDADGNGTVTAADFNAFRLQYGQSGPSIFDFNADDQVSASDFNQFRTRYGVTVAP